MNKWLHIDLHMHSFYSKKYDTNRVKEMSASDFVANLKSKGIEIFSITDHDTFSSKYYSEVLEAIKNENIRIIPGTELNIYVENGGKFQANFYFSTDVNTSDLEKAIKELYDNDNKPDFSSIIDKFNAYQFNFMIFPEADKAGGISRVIKRLEENNKLDDIKRIQKNGMQRIFKAYDSKVKFDKTSANMWALSYYKLSDEFHKIFDVMEEARVNEITGKISNCLKGVNISSGDTDYKLVKDITAKIINYGGCFSYFHFSDWHNKETYTLIAKNYIYGNLDLPFESLELAVLDPISRVNVLKLNEDITVPMNNIKKISFIMDGRENSIDFSIGLNAIVGKRASGKSLLMAIILKLLDKNDKRLSAYLSTYKVDVDSIVCETYEGQKIKAGQLGSLEYIEQDTISNIFNNPQESENGIKRYFSSIEEFDSSNLDDLIEQLKKVEPYNKNYKAVNSYIISSKGFKSYSYSNIKTISGIGLDTQYTALINSLNQYKQEIIKIGFDSSEIERIKQQIIIDKELMDKKISLYNSLSFTVNSKIKEIRDANSVQIEQNNLARTNYANSKKIILDNFEHLLTYKKVEFIVNNFNIKIPKMIKNKKDKYIFVSYYEVKSDVKDSIREAIEDSFVKKGHDERGIDLLNLYINGCTTLKSGVLNIYSSIEKKFISDNLSLKNIMYENVGGVDYDKLENTSDLEKNVKDGLLENITNSSLGRKSIAYLELILDSDASILLFDQPEDNVDNNYISQYFVPLIKQKKKTKQLIFITHNPSVAVYADAFNYIYAFNNGEINYSNHYIESVDDKQKILDILDGGTPSFANRNMKYGNIIGEYKYDVKNN